MKKLLVFLTFTLPTSYAQLEKGAKLVGVQFNLLVNDMYSTRLAFSSSNGDYGLSISPTFGYALQRNWLLGAQATLGFEHVKNSLSVGTYTTSDTYTDLGIAPFTRLYLDITKDQRLKAFGLATLEIVNGHSRTKYTYTGGSTSSTTGNYNSVTGALGGGLGYFGRKIVIDLSMSTTALRLSFYKVFGSLTK